MVVPEEALFVELVGFMENPLKFLKIEEGASAVEYALLVSLIAAVIVVVVSVLGNDVSGLFDSLDW